IEYMPRKGLAALSRPRGLWPGLLLVFGLVVFFLAIRMLGQFTRDSVRDTGRYALAFSSIDCPTPPAQTRAEFLTEVQYLSGTGDRLQLLERDLPARLAVAFGRHPWVEKVERITILSPPGLRVELAYRIPVLQALLSSRVRQVGLGSADPDH